MRPDQRSSRIRAAVCAAVLLLAGGFLAGQQPQPKTTALETKAAGAKTFYADSRVGNNQVTVFSESTLEDFTGVCNRVSGQCTIDPRQVEGVSGRFSIRMADLKTGINLRDEHMLRPEWLDAARHPEVVVKIDKAEDVKKTAPATATLLLVGSCAIKGKTHPVRFPASLTYLDETPETMRRCKGDLLRIRSEFDVKLSDYDITGPKGSDFIGLKVAEVVKLKVTVFASTEKPADPLKADRPEGGARRPAPVRPAAKESGGS